MRFDAITVKKKGILVSRRFSLIKIQRDLKIRSLIQNTKHSFIIFVRNNVEGLVRDFIRFGFDTKPLVRFSALFARRFKDEFTI
jgi:hypothetical protein